MPFTKSLIGSSSERNLASKSCRTAGARSNPQDAFDFVFLRNWMGRSPRTCSSAARSESPPPPAPRRPRCKHARSPATSGGRWRTRKATAPPPSPGRGPPGNVHPRGKPPRTPTVPSPPRRRSQTKQDAPGQPLTQARRQQQLLLTITRKEVLGHAQIVPTDPDDTAPLCNSRRAKQ
jgi:hypothetical protein